MSGEQNGPGGADPITDGIPKIGKHDLLDQERNAANPVGNRRTTAAGGTLHPESLVPRLGDFLLQMGVLRWEELRIALEEQQQRHRLGRPDLLGRVLLDLGFVDRATLDHAVTLQVMELHWALSRHNRELEEEVSRRTEQLEQALRRELRMQQQKDEFVSAISHELRTPLTLVLGYLELFTIGDMGPVPPNQEQALTRMFGAAVKLRQLINNLILFASYYRDELDVSFEPLPVSSLFQTVLKEKVHRAQKLGIRLLVGAPQQPVFLAADPGKIAWVLSELLENALKFSDRGSEVRLVGRQRNDNQFEILVRDNGPGIPAQRLDDVFEPFRQLDGSTTRKVGGIGLGLALAQRILRVHDSQIELLSRLGEGTRVSFALPLFN